LDHGSSLRHARAVVWDEFLVIEELEALLDYTGRHEREFTASQVFDPGGNRPAYRRSRVSLNTGWFHDMIAQRMAFYLPRILRALDRPYFNVTRVESQLTASNDGDYFRVHNDNSQANWPSREITYVYFFHREPRAFSGGELVLYDSREDGGVPEPVLARKRITPEQNTIVFFDSSVLHEVTPVSCPSQRFADSRFTLNGWLHR
jgi:SM-20-related protein